MELPLGAPSQSSSTSTRLSKGAPNHGFETVVSSAAVTSDNFPEHLNNNYEHAHELHTISVTKRKKHPLYVPTIEYYLDASRIRPQHTHRPSRSRINRIPPKMSGIVAPSGAKNALSGRSETREPDNIGDDGLLHPRTHDTIRSRRESDSTIGLEATGRKDDLFDRLDSNQKLNFSKHHEPRSAEDLKLMKSRRKHGEGQLRNALLNIGNFATDVTRILDYTYYSLLEKIARLTSTVSLFQELSDSLSTICNDFERETTGLDQDIQKQMRELNGFQPQLQKIEKLEERMSSGKSKAEALGKKLEAIRDEIDRWERREAEWQTRVARRLRIFWAVVTASLLISSIIFASQNRLTLNAAGLHVSLPDAATDHCSACPSLALPENKHPRTTLDDPGGETIMSQDQLGCASRASCQSSSVADILPFDEFSAMPERASQDPLRRLDEL